MALGGGGGDGGVPFARGWEPVRGQGHWNSAPLCFLRSGGQGLQKPSAWTFRVLIYVRGICLCGFHIGMGECGTTVCGFHVGAWEHIEPSICRFHTNAGGGLEPPICGFQTAGLRGGAGTYKW